MAPRLKKNACVGAGFIVLDIIRDAVENGTIEKRFAGGSCGNVLSILSYLGWTASAVGRIGDDQAGQVLLQDLKKWGVKTEWLSIEAGRGTPVIIQENYLDSKGRPRHRFSRACPLCGTSLPAFRPLLVSDADLVDKQLPAHNVFYFDRVAPGTLDLAQRSRTRGSLVVFEPSGIKDPQMFSECLKTSHIVKYSNDRIRDVHEMVAKAKVPVEVETLGAKGLRLRVRANGRFGDWKELAAFPVPELRDASGSGDWCTSGIVHRLIEPGASSIDEHVSNTNAVVTAARFGQALAALNCGFQGARGLMYAVDAKKVLESATAIVSGQIITPLLEATTKNRPKERTKERTAAFFGSILHPHS